MPPAVSIILPTYDRLAFLREAVGSVLAQTMADWELIVIDDSSTDDSVAWLRSHGDARIHVVEKAHTGCPALLRNIGISQAKAEWIAFLDSDDRWLPEKLERQLAFHSMDSRIRWSYTAHTIIDAAGEERPPGLFKARKPYAGRIFRELLELEAIIALPSVFAERALLNEAGGFDETMKFVEDYELWLRLALLAECGVVNEPLTVVRTHRSTSFDRAEVDDAFMSVYRRIASSQLAPELCDIAATREGYYAVWAANKWANQREWRRAINAAAIAVRRQPLNRSAYRAILHIFWRMLRAAGPAND